MKICLVSYRYFVSSGPERYLFGVKDLLEERGHEVIPFSVRYRANEPTPWAKYFVEPIAGDDEIRFRQHSWTVASVRRALERAFYSREVYDALSAELRDAKPDVAYVLPYIRKLSPSVLAALHDHGVPTAVRFSDFAMVCPQPHLFRNDQICELCVGHEACGRACATAACRVRSAPPPSTPWPCTTPPARATSATWTPSSRPARSCDRR